MKHFIFTFIMFIYMCVVIFAMTACNDQRSSTLTPVSSTGSSPSDTPPAEKKATPTPKQQPPPISVETTALDYYQAIEAQSYAYAYSFLDRSATGLSRVAFIQMAHSADKAEGKVVSFSVAAFPPQVVMTVSRNFGPYHVHLLFRQEGNAWKIASLDRI